VRLKILLSVLPLREVLAFPLDVELVLERRLCVGLDDRDGRVLLGDVLDDLLNSDNQWQDMTFSISWVRTWKRSIKNIWWGLRASYIGLCLWMRGARCTVFCACWGVAGYGVDRCDVMGLYDEVFGWDGRLGICYRMILQQAIGCIGYFDGNVFDFLSMSGREW